MILKDSVIYVLKAIEDKKAQSNTPIMGYELEADYQVCYSVTLLLFSKYLILEVGEGRIIEEHK